VSKMWQPLDLFSTGFHEFPGSENFNSKFHDF